MRPIAQVLSAAAFASFAALLFVPSASAEEPLTTEQRAELTKESDRLLKEGNALDKEKKWDGAIKKYEQALALARRLTPDGDIEQVKLLTLTASTHFRAHQLTAGVGALDRANALMQKVVPVGGSGDHAQAVRVFDFFESLYWAYNRYEDAARCKELAFRHCARLYPLDRFPHGHREVANRVLGVGMKWLEVGDTVKAREFYLLSVDLRRKLYPKDEYPDGHPAIALALNNTGYFFGQVGDWDSALDYYSAGLEMRRALYPVEKFPKGNGDLVSSLSNTCFALLNLGRPLDARRHIDEALKMARSLPSVTLEQMCLSKRGFVAHADGKFEEAAATYREVLALLEEEIEPKGGSLTQLTLNNLGCVLTAMGKYDEAEKALTRSLELVRKLYRANGDGVVLSEAQLLINLGDLYARRGDVVKGIELNGQGADMFRLALAGAAWRESEADALGDAAAFPGPDGVLSWGHGRPEFDATAYAQVWDEKGLVFRVLEHRKVLLKVLKSEAGRAIWAELQDARFRLAAAVAAPATTPDRATRIKELTAEKERLERTFAAQLPAERRNGVTDFGRPADLCARLPKGTVFVDVVRYLDWTANPPRPLTRATVTKQPYRYAAFVLAAGGKPVRVELGDAKVIDAAVRDWRAAAGLQGDRGATNARSAITAVGGGAIAEGDPTALRGLRKVREKAAGTTLAAAGADLRKRVWEPIAKTLPAGTRTVYLCPDGDLAQLPWEAVPGSNPDRVLLEEFAFARVPHGPFLLRHLAVEAKPAPPGSVFALGAVDYGRGTGGYPKWAALPGTARELDLLAAVAGSADVTAVRGADATIARTLTGLTGARVAHIATHGYFANDQLSADIGARAGVLTRARNPLAYCGLVLAGAEEAGGMLTAETIAGLALDKLDLAVLSACETGLGSLSAREGSFGLPRAFHLAGCRNVVASLWPVDDDGTAAVMAGFYYRLLTKKEGPLEALRGAQLAVFRHPDLIADLSGRRGKEARIAAMEKTSSEKPTDAVAGPRAQVALWAAFHLSGPGR